MEEVVCAERSGFPFGPGAWPEFWTLLFWSLARPLAVRGVRESEVHRRFGASGLPLASCSSRSCVSSSRTKLARGVWSVRARRSVCARLCHRVCCCTLSSFMNYINKPTFAYKTVNAARSNECSSPSPARRSVARAAPRGRAGGGAVTCEPCVVCAAARSRFANGRLPLQLV